MRYARECKYGDQGAQEAGQAEVNRPVEAAFDVIGGQWKVVILCWPKEGTLRFGELRRRIPGVGERMLTQHLRELEQDGIVHRKVYPQVPPKGEYSLTSFGETLRPIMVLLNE